MRYLSVFFLALLLTACETTDEVLDSLSFSNEEDAPIVAQDQPSDVTLFQSAKSKLIARRFRSAIKDFEEIERLYPFSKFATKAQIMIAYAYYRNEDFDDAINVIDAFTRLHPAHKHVGYMYYLRALSYYARITDTKRDQSITMQARDALGEVVRRFPDTAYARDAKLKLDLVQDHLAGKQMEIGRFYLVKGQYVAAINRFKKVVEHFDTTSQAEEALYRLTEAYISLGIIEEAKKYAAVLGHNYPDSKWYRYAYRITAEGKNAPKEVNRMWLEELLDGDSIEPEPLPDLGTDHTAETWFEAILPDI